MQIYKNRKFEASFTKITGLPGLFRQCTVELTTCPLKTEKNDVLVTSEMIKRKEFLWSWALTALIGFHTDH